jgi:hypothetical protein
MPLAPDQHEGLPESLSLGLRVKPSSIGKEVKLVGPVKRNLPRPPGPCFGRKELEFLRSRVFSFDVIPAKAGI